MKTGNFEYAITARCNRTAALPILAEFKDLNQLHPLVLHVKQLQPQAGVLRSYQITDQLRWGPFAFKLRYQADVLHASDEEIITKAYHSMQTTIQSRTTLQQDGPFTHIQVKMTMTFPSLLFDYAFQQGKTAHTEFAVKLKKHLESL